MKITDIEAAIAAAVHLDNGRQCLSCARAHVLAEDMGVPLKEIGSYCQSHDIKITDCQLGCFGGHKNQA